MLTCEPETPLDRMRRRKEYDAMAEDDICGLFETTVSELTENGYPLYEISNFARKDSDRPDINRSRHNQKYWTGAAYLGFGPAAHSYLCPVRSRNHRDIGMYLEDLQQGRLPVAETEDLNPQQQLMEIVFLGLRTQEGISIQRFEACAGRSFEALFQDLLTDPELGAFFSITPERCALTIPGMLVLDSISAMFVDRI